MGIFQERGLLHHSLTCGHHDELVLAELLNRENGGYLLPLREVEEVHYRLPPGGPATLRDLVHLEPEDLSGVGEEEHVVLGGCDE